MSSISYKINQDAGHIMQEDREQERDYVADYIDYVLKGDYTRAEKIVENMLQRMRWTMADVYLKLFSPAQVRIGEMWHADEIGIADEHAATQITLNHMARLRQDIKPSVTPRARALVTTAEGETHNVGPRMVADLLIADGWAVDYLGSNTPRQAVVSFLENRVIDLVLISATMKNSDIVSRLAEMVSAIHNLPTPPKILVGGTLFRENPELAQEVGADGTALDAVGAIHSARVLVAEKMGNVSLDQYLQVLGQRILALRQDTGWTQQQLANEAELDRTYISAVENGKQNVTFGAILKIAKAFHLPVETLIVNEDEITRM